MDKETVEYYKKHAIGISIIHLRSVYKEQNDILFHAPMDFHIHVLYYKDPEMNYVSGMCLDTSDIQMFPFTGENVHDITRIIGIDLAKIFVDKITSMMKADKYESRLLFQKVDRGLWDFFNDIKAESFVNNIKRFSGYVKANSVRISDNERVSSPDDNYNNFDIWLSEGREVKEELKSMVASR